jgi:hypothetical protein
MKHKERIVVSDGATAVELRLTPQRVGRLCELLLHVNHDCDHSYDINDLSKEGVANNAFAAGLDARLAYMQLTAILNHRKPEQTAAIYNMIRASYYLSGTGHATAATITVTLL